MPQAQSNDRGPPLHHWPGIDSADVDGTNGAGSGGGPLMAGEWIKVEHATPDKPEVKKMARVLSMTAEKACGHLLRVWIWADQQSLNGHALDVTDLEIDDVARHAGFAKAMREVQWLTGDEGRVSFPNFKRHNSKSAKKRALAADRKRTQRSRSGSDNGVTRGEKRRSKTPLPPYSGAFLRFWAAWPKHHRKQAQGQCWERWLKHDLEQSADTILSHVEALKLSIDWRKENGKYIPAPAVYLNDRRWEGAELPLEESEPRRAVV